MPFGMSLGFKTAKAGALSATPDLVQFREESFLYTLNRKEEVD